MNCLKNIDNLSIGIDKQWIWKDKDNYYRSRDYLQKINFCIQDLNRELNNLCNPSMKEVVYIIVLIDWIREAVDAIPKILRPEVMEDYVYENEDMTNKSIDFFKAIRSFVVAHPLSTNRHTKILD